MSIQLTSFQNPLAYQHVGDAMDRKTPKKDAEDIKDERDFRQSQQSAQALLDAHIRPNSKLYTAPTFSGAGLYDSLDLDDAPPSDKQLSASENAESIPSFAMLETVKKRQDNKPINTQDVIDDFLKTANMLGAGEHFEEKMHRYFEVVGIETQFKSPNTKLIKATFSGLAKRLDEKVSDTLGEPSSVVQDWLDALFTQPITWDTPLGSNQRSTSFNLTNNETPVNRVKLNERLQQLLVNDSSLKTVKALKQKDLQAAEQHIYDVLNQAEMLPQEVQKQWENMLLRILHKQGKHDELLSEVNTRQLDKRPALQPLIAEAQAHTGRTLEAVKTLYSHLNLSQRKSEDISTVIKQWTMLNTWTSQLKNPALEEKMLGGLWRVSQKKEQSLSPETLDHLGKYQRLKHVQGDKVGAIQIAKARVTKSKQNQDRGRYIQSLQDLASLFISTGQVKDAEKVIALTRNL